MNKYAHISLLLLFHYINLSNQISCKDDWNRNVDWFIFYKLPKIANEPVKNPFSDGLAYVFISSRNPGKWKLSTQIITSPNSILGKTWKELKNNEEKATYLFYNDDTPDIFKGSAVGHLKGILAFDKKSGYWLSHSIPRFGRILEYEYPNSAITNGQHAICVTFKTSALNDISRHLLFGHPNIYLKKANEDVLSLLDSTAKTLFSDKPAFRRTAPFQRIGELESAMGQKFLTFAKDNQLPEDLFSNIIAPRLRSSLYVESWRRGVGTFLPPTCRTVFTVIDVTSINMTVTTRGTKKSLYFKSTEDHSKWAISTACADGWICLADMNRMESQEKRGGGALCFKSTTVWEQFKNIISDTDTCQLKK